MLGNEQQKRGESKHLCYTNGKLHRLKGIRRRRHERKKNHIQRDMAEKKPSLNTVINTSFNK